MTILLARAGIVMTVVQIGTLTVSPTGYYIFFSAIEIAATAFIVRTAFKWANPQVEQKKRPL